MTNSNFYVTQLLIGQFLTSDRIQVDHRGVLFFCAFDECGAVLLKFVIIW